jgi:cellulose synthase/poly-beta-1,6-N-acetylglucosamine synthase-like glycosyltransferase
LRWALDRLHSEAFDAVSVVDADTRLCPDFLAVMDQEIRAGAVALQSRNEFDFLDSSYFSLLSFASKRAESELFWRARQRLHLLGFLSGNGFCLHRSVLEAFPWSAYSIVEDIEFSLQMTIGGVRVKFLDNARVSSKPSRQAAEAFSQRLRWASGTLRVIIKYGPQLLRASLKQRSPRLAEAALALTLTSRFFLLYLVLGAAACTMLVGTTGGGVFLRVALVASLLLLCAYGGMVLSRIPNVRGGRVRALVKLPFYLVWMVLIHASAVVGIRRNVWVRGSR